jgi:diamine N-acetyltransferase
MVSSTRLVEIAQGTLQPVLSLAVAPVQAHFVAPNAVSIAEAHFEPGAWFRAIESDGEPVGFAMIFDPTLPGARAEPPFDEKTILLWRFMIDHRFQGQGFGRDAIACLVEHVRTRPGISHFAVTYVEAPGGPAPFYQRVGFLPTGRILDSEAEAVLAL